MRLPPFAGNTAATLWPMHFVLPGANKRILYISSDESLNYACEEVTMSERKPRENPNQRASVGFVLMLLLSTLGLLVTVPASSASTTGSLGITGSTSPVPDAWYSSFDTVSFEAEVTNFFASPSGAARPSPGLPRRTNYRITLQVGLR